MNAEWMAAQGRLAAGIAAPLRMPTLRWAEPVSVERVTVPVAGLHAALDGFRIVQMSDLHLDPFPSHAVIEEAFAAAARLRPDLLVLTGDYVTRTAEAIFDLPPLLAHLNARCGVYAVMGNHDVRANSALIRRTLVESGLCVLHNGGQLLTVGQGRLFVAGVDDGLVGRPLLAQALDGCPADVPAVLLAHEPDLADRYLRDPRLVLQLSGHSHGGQVRLPRKGPLVLPRLGRLYPHGLYRVRGRWLYTNRGLGCVRFPVRLNCRPEVTELTLVQASSGQPAGG